MSKQQNNNFYPILFVGLGSIVCLGSWLALGVIPWFVIVSMFLLWGLTLYVTWKKDQFIPGTTIFFLLASLVGVFLEANREMSVPLNRFNEWQGRPIIGDDDGLWTLIFPFIIFWWVVVKAIGKLLYRRDLQKKSGGQLPKMPLRQKIWIGTILFFGVYFFISFIVSTIKGSQ